MSWLDDLQEGSFRDVGFKISAHQGKSGHRLQITDIPDVENPDVQEFGNKQKNFTIDCYVIGDDYNIERDNLIKALDKRGPGKLVHPYYGIFQVYVSEYSWSESINELHMVRFQIQVVVANGVRYPIIFTDVKTNVAIKKQNSVEAVKEDFTDRYSLSNKVTSFSTITQSAIDKALSDIETFKRNVSSETSYRREIERIKGRAIALSYDALELIENISDLISFGLDEDDTVPVSNENAKDSFLDMNNLVTFKADDILTEDKNDPTFVLQETFKLLAVINQVAVLSFIEFTSSQEALTFREQAYESLDSFIESTENDNVYNTLVDLRTSVTENLDVRVRDLPKLVEYTPNISLPALVIAHNLYGSIDREKEIIERNNISHPGFVPAQIPLEVLFYGD